MDVRHDHRLSICLASALLSLRMVSSKVSLWIWQALFVYATNLPVANRIPPGLDLAVRCTAAFCFRPLFNGLNRRNVHEVIDLAIPMAIYLCLVLAIHSESSLLADWLLTRQLTWVASFDEFKFLFPLFALIFNTCNTVQSIVVVSWMNIVRIFQVLNTAALCFLGEIFFDHKDFVTDLAAGCVGTFVDYLVYHLVYVGIGKLICGYNQYSWSHWYFGRPLLVWLVFWNIMQSYNRCLYRLPRRRRPCIPKGTPAYKYTALDPGRIRLLLLHPRHPDSPIRCSLVTTPLERPPMFEAMSYTWGNVERDGRFQILVDGHAVNVTANAFNLLHDRSSYLFPQLLWIDSICINQDDVNEKTQQVRMMDRIYRAASLVTVWLSSTTKQERSVLEQFQDSMRAVWALDLISRITLLDPPSPNKYLVYKRLLALRTSTGIVGSRQWDQLMKLPDNDWFERIWVVQEVVLGSSVRVLYDRVEMDWRPFVEGLAVLALRAPVLVDWTDNEGLVRKNSRGSKLANILNIHVWKGSQAREESINFADMVMAARGFRATDARDKIFAIRGISSDAENPRTLPDYTKPLSAVYLEAALRIASEGDIFRAMSAAGVGYFDEPTKNLEGLPSWVPDFSRDLPCVNLSHRSQWSNYRAGGPTCPNSCCPKGSTVVIEAQMIDVVTELALITAQDCNFSNGRF